MHRGLIRLPLAAPLRPKKLVHTLEQLWPQGLKNGELLIAHHLPLVQLLCLQHRHLLDLLLMRGRSLDETTGEDVLVLVDHLVELD